MRSKIDWVWRLVFVAAAACSAGRELHAACSIREETRTYEGRERTIVIMENDSILVEVVPSAAGKISMYKDKTKDKSAFEWLDDCPYHYGCRWEGKPFTYTIGKRGPDRVSLTVKGGGKVAVATLRDCTGLDLATPLELTCERTMEIDANSTRLKVGVKIGNAGNGIAPRFRYMMHGVWGQVPRAPFCFLLPTENGITLFDTNYANKEFRSDRGNPAHPHNRFTPERRADKPRYAAAGWVALLTSVGPTYIYYDPSQFDFFQYWYGGDSAWHWTCEPHSKPVDLAPGQSVTVDFTLAYDADDVPFNTGTVSIEKPELPGLLTPSSKLAIRAKATTARNKPERASFDIRITDPDGAEFLNQELSGTVKGFALTDLSFDAELPDDAKLGRYQWKATRSDGKELASGAFEVLTAESLAKRKTDEAIAALNKKHEQQRNELQKQRDRAQRHNRYWRDGAELALSMRDPRGWNVPDEPRGPVAVRVLRGATNVIGRWKAKEPPRIQRYFASPPPKRPADTSQMLGALGDRQGMVRDAALRRDGRELVALVVDEAAKRVEVVRLSGDRIVGRFGSYADKPGESDDRLGSGARALAVDDDGNIWVATNAWGTTSVFVAGPTGQPSEETRPGQKGAVKKFDPSGRLLGTVSLLEAPMSLVLAKGDDTPVVLAAYRNVSKYHGAQVRQGAEVIRVSDAARLGAIKVPAGSVVIDESGWVWSADVAGHVARFNRFGAKQFPLAGTQAPAGLDAKLPSSSPLPAVIRCDGEKSTWVLYSFTRSLQKVEAQGGVTAKTVRTVTVPEGVGRIRGMLLTADGPVVFGERGSWGP